MQNTFWHASLCMRSTTVSALLPVRPVTLATNADHFRGLGDGHQAVE